MLPPATSVIESLERILASPLFSRADRQSRFLRHIVEKFLAGDEESLRETAIGLEVYGRPGTYDPKEDSIVRVEAARLRGRLREYYEDERAADPIRIRIPKGSYVPSFEWTAPPLESPPPTDPAFAPLPLEKPPVSATAAWSRFPRPILLLSSLAVMMVAAYAWYSQRQSPPRTRPIELIAVMPFTDLSEKKDLSHLSEGLTEQIRDELTRIRNLRVIGSASAGQAAANPDLRAAARQIGADALLQGSLRSEGSKVRVTVRLYDGATATAIWSGSFEGDRAGLFQLEDQIAHAVAAKLEIQLAVRREGIDVIMAPQRAQAYDYVQQARALSEKDSAGPRDEILRLYQLAATTDPLYAPAHIGIAETLIVTASPDKTRAFAEARRGLELDPELPRARSVQILYYRDVEMDWAKARSLCASSLQRFPNSGAILRMCATVEGITLNPAKTVELTRRAAALDPLSPGAHGGLMLALYQAGQFDEALREANAALQLGSPSNFVRRHRALILGAMGKPTEGLADIDDAQARSGGVLSDWAPVRGYLLGRSNQSEAARKYISQYADQSPPPHHLGIMYLGLDDRPKALDYFEKSLRVDASVLANTIPEYYMRVLDGNPRFEAIKRKLRM